MRQNKSIIQASALIIGCFAVGLCIGLLVGRHGKGNGDCTLTVLETTDVHGAYFDSLYNGEARKTSMANVAAYVKNVRKVEKADPILIDNGDNLQGDNAAYYYNFVDTTSEHVVTSYLKYLDYDAVVMGNHDVETGHPVYDRVCRSGKMPYLAANAVGEDGKPYFKPYKIVRRHGLKIAIIGMTNANIKSWLPEDKWRGIDFVQISAIAQGLVDEVRAKERPDIVIMSVHSGTGKPDRPGPKDLPRPGFEPRKLGPDIENEAYYLASSLKGVDVVLAGHDHSPAAEVLSTPDGEVAFVNGGSRAQFVGRCDIKLRLKRGKIVSKTFQCKTVPMEGIEPDEAFSKKFRPQFEEVKAFACRPIGRIMGDIAFDNAIDGPSAYMTLIHTVQLDATGADISISAPLSTRGKIGAGPVAFQDLTKIYIYENQLFVVEMTGRQLKDYLEYSYANWISRRGPSFNFDSAQGIDYTVSRSAADGSRVKISGMSDGEPFQMDKVYKVAMTSYRASGGGELLARGAGINPSDLKISDKYKDIRSLIGDWIAARGEVVPAAAANWKFVD